MAFYAYILIGQALHTDNQDYPKDYSGCTIIYWRNNETIVVRA